MDLSTAERTFTRRQIIFICALAIITVLLFPLLGAIHAGVVLVSVVSALYFIDLLFNFALVIRSLHGSHDYAVTSQEISSRRGEWPTYTVFCPLYKEVSVLPQFVQAINKLDYPKDRLTVQLLLEEDDTETITAARAMNLPEHFQIVVVPDSQPKTKPKACNHGLTLARSTYSVIYDAEDVPQADQLKKAVIAFEEAPGDIACLQAKLNFYNINQNLLTRMFTAEYSLWFNLVLVGLQSINAPIPLGGTSNHFKTEVLQGLNGWDPFNVTEDCDLGIRLYKQGYRTAILDSTTFEEANSQLGNWVRQRSRWVKGYMQTYLVHTRDLGGIRQSRFDLHVLTFQLIVGGKIMSLFINPLMWILTLGYFALNATFAPLLQAIYPAPIFYIAIFTLVMGNFLYLYYYMLGCARRQQWGLIKYVLLVPFYWLMMSVAAVYALYQLIVKPHYWEKTVHGLHLGANVQ